MDGAVRLRIQLVVLAMLVLYAALAARCYVLSHKRHDHYRSLADRQQLRRIDEAPWRGEIRDREGRLLAVSRLVPSLYANPRVIADPRRTAALLAPLVGRDEDHLLRRLMRRKRAFVWLARHLEPRTADRVRALKIKGLGFRHEPKRYYPQGALAAHVVGFCGTDGTGLEGVERSWDATLSGRAGAKVELRDAKLGLVRLPEALGSEARDGDDLHLTLDLVVQRIAEQELDAACAEFRPAMGVAIVLEAGTSEVLALAVRPTFDPGRFGDAPKSVWRNAALTDCFEPGSTIKPLVAAFGIEHGLFDLGTIIDCHNGRWRYRGRTLHDSHGEGRISLADVVVQSSNIGMAQVGLALGGKRLRSCLGAVGLGRRPEGLRHAGASPGRLTPLSKWSYYSTTSVPMGHEMLVSPLQLATAINVFASDGLWQPARLVRATAAPGQEPVPLGRRLSRQRVMSRAVAAQMRGVLGRVVEDGTGKRAKLEHIRVGGKTGTAQKLLPDGTYSHSSYVSSFVAIAPVERPRVTVFVLLDDPHTEQGKPYGGRVAAPAVKNIINRTLAYLGARP